MLVALFTHRMFHLETLDKTLLTFDDKVSILQHSLWIQRNSKDGAVSELAET